MQLLQLILTCAVMLYVVSEASDYIDYGHQNQWGHYTSNILGPFTKTKLNYCDDTVQQSPINIDAVSTAECPVPNGDLEWILAESVSVSSFTVTNNGHSLSVKPSDSLISQFGFLVNKFSAVANVHSLYCLAEIHIHWGASDADGSEHQLNAHPYPLEMHFVHYACNYDSLQNALNAQTFQDRNKLAVVGVFFEIGDVNLFFDDIVANLHALEVAGSQVTIAGMDIAEIFSASVVTPDTFGDYYHYDGSLTTPPCTPIVSWHVLKEPFSLSAAQLKAVRDTIKNNAPTPVNAAPCYRSLTPQLSSTVVYSC